MCTWKCYQLNCTGCLNRFLLSQFFGSPYVCLLRWRWWDGRRMGGATQLGLFFRPPAPIETFEFEFLSTEDCSCSRDCVNTVFTVQVLRLRVLYSGYCRDSCLGVLHQPWASKCLNCVCTGKATCHLTVIFISWSNPHWTTVESNFCY